MKTKMRILAQVRYEGKPKGGQEFIIEVDSDFVMYCPEDKLIAGIQKLLDKESTKWAEDFTYISHELLFIEPEVLEEDLRDFIV